MTFGRTTVYGLLLALVTATLGAGLAFAVSPGAPPAQGNGGCPSSNALGNFNQSSVVAAWAITGANNWSYQFSSLVNLSPSGGVPGLIQYCVYPGTLPDAASASAVGADGSSFTVSMGSNQGFFAFGRSHGDPSNLPLDGSSNLTVGTAGWAAGAPSNQTILLHINDASECQGLYGGTSNTCFVFPATPTAPPCNGAPVCKTVAVAEQTSTNPTTVPIDTMLHLHFTYTVVNAASNTFNMEFLTIPAGNLTGFTGLRDVFSCIQSPDPSGSPGAGGITTNYQSTGLDLGFHQAPAKCNAWTFRMTNSGSTIVLHPGQSIVFTVDMVTKTTGYTTAGIKCVNDGVLLVWHQSDDGLLHSYKTPRLQITVV